ncbi:MAG TPA: glycosyltransferase family 2 protein, partial [Propionibacterium sp.]|nr:glycosyltransferase family 2 protein [Propionibacterium sp.]
MLPVYNVEQYLAFCLESVRNQSVRDIEIICVDDGSLDRSRVLLQMAAAADERVVIVSKPNGGLSSARNAGLAVATGDLVLFVDSDDFLHRKACETILAAHDEAPADIITFGAHIHPAAHATPWLTRTLSPRRVSYQGFDPALLFDEASRPFVWRSAFSREFLIREGLRFDETVLFGEDQVFYFAAYPLARRTQLIPDKLYYYRASRPDSLMASRYEDRERMMLEHHHITRVILELWQERGWLATWRGEMLEWVFDFLGEEAFTGHRDLTPRLRASLAELVGEFFTDGPWVDALPTPARSLREVLAHPDAGGGPAALLAWQGATDPRSAVRRVGRR